MKETLPIRNVRRMALVLLAAVASFSSAKVAATPFVRGDANSSGAIDLSDAIHTLGFLFQESPKSLPCESAADSNDDGGVDISDPVFLLFHLFEGGLTPPAPFPGCGEDPTQDSLGCAAFLRCAQPVDCMRPAELEALVSASIPREICLAPAYLSFAGDPEVILAPESAAGPCGTPPRPGSLVRIDSASSRFTAIPSRLVIHVEGKAPALPIEIRGRQIDVLCTSGIAFRADLVIPLRLKLEPGGKLRIEEVFAPRIENVASTLDARGEPLCEDLKRHQAALFATVARKLESLAGVQVKEQGGALVGKTVCAASEK